MEPAWRWEREYFSRHGRQTQRDGATPGRTVRLACQGTETRWPMRQWREQHRPATGGQGGPGNGAATRSGGIFTGPGSSSGGGAGWIRHRHRDDSNRISTGTAPPPRRPAAAALRAGAVGAPDGTSVAAPAERRRWRATKCRPDRRRHGDRDRQRGGTATDAGHAEARVTSDGRQRHQSTMRHRHGRVQTGRAGLGPEQRQRRRGLSFTANLASGSHQLRVCPWIRLRPGISRW